MRYPSIAVIVATTLLAVSANAQQPDPKKLKDQLTGDAEATASANPQCKLFTQAEISALAGASLGPGENAAGGTGCLWTDKDYESSALVQVVPASYFSEPRLVKGFRPLPGIGTKAWVAPDYDWSAGSLVQTEAVVVVLKGKKATEASAVALLQEVIKRRKP
ncbi:hypothetical protein [uncultured Thiocystis sp.]|jgi:hypothetical protein|uniref:hypothetical protein n=1 Tax=uncultured Thiocystis sp. TaxID=1202134 RepID=UPI0025DDEE90|nr:hypothetical protein [uncultured Thiocystis sp.]